MGFINPKDEMDEDEEEEEDDDSGQLSPLEFRKEVQEHQDIHDDGEEVGLPPPPDGGWGWVVCIASFLCNMILDGIAYSFGVILTPLCKYFDAEAGTVSWVGSLLCGIYLMSGPIVGGLVNKFGCRPVCIAGSLITCLAFGLSVFSTNVAMLMVTYGVIGGFGLGLIYLPAVVAVGYYFESKRALATGISVCGSGVGTFVFAPFATYLLDVYGWRGANIIFAGLCLQCAVFGALMRPLTMSVLVVDKDKEEVEEHEDKCVLQLPDGTIHRQTVSESKDDSPLPLDQVVSLSTHKVGGLPTITEQQVSNGTKKEENGSNQEVFPSKLVHARKKHRTRTTSEGLTDSKKMLAPLIKLSPTKEGKIPRNQSAPHFISSPITRVGSTVTYSIGSGSKLEVGDGGGHLKEANIIVRPLSRKDIFYSRSIYSVDNMEGEHMKSQMSVARSGLRSNKQSYISMNSGLRSNKASFISVHRGSLVNSALALPIISESKRMSVASIGQKDVDVVEGGGGGMLAVLKEMMNFSLLGDPLFLLIGISNVFGMIGFYTPFVYLPNMAAQFDDIGVENAAFLVSIIGVSNTIGRVLSGWMADFTWVNSLVVTNIAIILSAVCVLLFPFCSSYAGFVIVALLFGFFVAAYIALTSVVLVDLLGLDNLTSAFGLLTLFRGSSSMIGPPINGWIFEATEDYSISFYVSGGFLLAAGLISCVVDLLKRRRDKALTHDE